jgi:hypothetical protein
MIRQSVKRFGDKIMRRFTKVSARPDAKPGSPFADRALPHRF